MRATMLLQGSPPYRREAFRAGLTRLGYTVTERVVPNPGPDDVLVVWNRKLGEQHHIRLYEARGGRVVVAENGYIGKSPTGGKLFALALWHHNGAGAWPVGGPERWASLGIELKPWRTEGDFILLLPQRGIGWPGIAMPPTWVHKAKAWLHRQTKRPIRIRPHPGMSKGEPYDDLRGAHCAVTWASGAGIKALAAGVPVFHGLPQWIGAAAARQAEGNIIEEPFLGDRLPMFERLAWSQWSEDEIESGEALGWLLKS